MGAKNKRRPIGLDVHQRFRAHLEANERAHEWARKALEYREAGHHARANQAELKARHWLQRATMLDSA
jgi:hypothetical protein